MFLVLFSEPNHVYASGDLRFLTFFSASLLTTLRSILCEKSTIKNPVGYFENICVLLLIENFLINLANFDFHVKFILISD